MIGQSDYRDVLRAELTRRCQANPRYSQRAFARDLRILPNRLSEVLSGKQGLSRDVAERVAGRLGYSALEKGYFCDLVDSRHARSPLKRQLATVRVEGARRGSESRMMAEEVFQVIADWHHFAILELTTLDGFRCDVRGITAALGLRKAQVTEAVERLMNLGLLTRSRGKFKATSHTDFAPGGVPSEAIRRFHGQVLAKAQVALSTQPVAEREFMTSLVGMPAGKIALGKREIQDFVANFGAKVRGNDAPTELYALGVQFFRLTEKPRLDAPSSQG